MEEHRVFLRPPLWLSPIIALLVGGAYITGKYVETRDREPTVIAVSGEGKAFAVPDIAEVSFGVETGRQKTAAQAMKVLREKMSQVFAAVKAQGVEEKDIRTQYLSLNPAYDYTEGVRIDRGFEANQSLQVKIRDLDTISAVLEAAVAQGTNQVGGVNFTIDDPEGLRAQAREKAIAQAKGKAKVLAGQIGRRLGTLKGFSEGGGYVPPPIYGRAMMMEAVGGDSALPVPAGEQEIMVNVTLSYELE